MARIGHGCGCGVGQQLQLRFDPFTWEPPYAMGVALKKKTKKTLCTQDFPRRQIQVKYYEDLVSIPGLSLKARDQTCILMDTSRIHFFF